MGPNLSRMPYSDGANPSVQSRARPIESAPRTGVKADTSGPPLSPVGIGPALSPERAHDIPSIDPPRARRLSYRRQMPYVRAIPTYVSTETAIRMCSGGHSGRPAVKAGSRAGGRNWPAISQPASQPVEYRRRNAGKRKSNRARRRHPVRHPRAPPPPHCTPGVLPTVGREIPQRSSGGTRGSPLFAPQLESCTAGELRTARDGRFAASAASGALTAAVAGDRPMRPALGSRSDIRAYRSSRCGGDGPILPRRKDTEMRC